jgi:hypothetical protein
VNSAIEVVREHVQSDMGDDLGDLPIAEAGGACTREVLFGHGTSTFDQR